MVWIMQLINAVMMGAECKYKSLCVQICESQSVWVSKEVAAAKMSGKMRHLGFLLRFRMNFWSGKGLLEYEMK